MSTAWTCRSSRRQQSGGKYANEPAANDRDAIAKLDARGGGIACSEIAAIVLNAASLG